jgi:SAM-dependent methyltransferase
MKGIWTPNWELEKYWDKVFSSPELMESYYKELKKELDVFAPLIDKIFGGKPKVPVVIDIGGGGFDGIFNFIRMGEREILIDPLASEFRKRYKKIPPDREIIDAYSYCLPLPTSLADVVFCINTLDHCNSLQEFNDSLSEIYRVLKPGGFLFFMLPIRDEQRDGHFICRNNVMKSKLMDGFKYDVLLNEWNYQCLYFAGRKTL